MNHPRAFLIAALITVSALAAAAPTVNAGPPGPRSRESTRPAGPEHARLTAMCGTWNVEMTFWFKPGGAGLTTTGTSTIRPLFDGLFIEEKIDGTLNGAPFTT